MYNNNKFPDYVPKKTNDTIGDYLKGPSKVYEVLKMLPETKLQNLKRILEIFEKYKKEAEIHPGGLKEGNVAIGADPDQYYPSDEELIVSETGKTIESIIRDSSKEEIIKFLNDNHINKKKIEFNEIYFRHVDVMGSGRFFYAEKKSALKVLNFI